MASESIGGVSISVNVDLSDLDAQFQAAVSEAASDGQKIGQAIADGINAGASGADAFQAALDKLVSEGNSANDAFQKLTGSTQTFVEALQSGALNDFADNFGKITSEAQAAAPALDQVASSAKSAADSLAQMSQSGAGSSSIGSMFSGAQDGISSLTSGLGQLDQATVISTGDFGELGTAIATMGGIALGVGGLKMLATDMADASDNLTRADISLTALTGDAGQAQGILSGLAQLGMSDGLSMPGLRQAAISMEALLPAGTDIVDVLGHVADASAVMGTSIDGLASRFDRMVDSGTLAARSIGSLGITMDDVGAAMTTLGATADNLSNGVAAAFKNLDPEGRVEVLTEALSKFQGVAEDVANNTFGGVWQQAANTFQADMATMGASVFQFGQQMTDAFNLPSINDTINETVADIYRITTAFQVVADAIAGIVAEIVTVISGIGTAFSRLFSGDWSGAVQAIKDLGTQMSAEWKTAQDQVAADVQAGQDKIAAILNQSQNVQFKLVPDFQAADDQMKAAQDEAAALGATVVDVSGKADSLAGHFQTSGVQIVDTIRVLQQATHDWYDSMSQVGDANVVAQSQLDALNQKVQDLGHSEAVLSDNLLNTQKSLAATQQAYDDGSKSLGDLEIAENRVVSASNSLVSVQKQLAAAQQELDNAFQVSYTGEKAFADNISTLGGIVLTAEDDIHDLGLGLLDIQPPPQMSALNTAMADLSSSAKAAKVPIDDLVTDIQNLAGNTATSWEDFEAQLSVFDSAMQKTMKTDALDAVNGLLAALGALANNNAPLSVFNQQLATTDAAIKKLATEDIGAANAAWDSMIAKMQQAGDAIGQVLAKQGEQAQANITWAEQSGTAADGWIYALEKVKLEQESLKTSADGMATSVVASINDVLKGFDGIGNAIGTAIVNGQNLGDALVTQFKKIAASILGDLIQGALTPLKKELTDLISSMLPDVTKGITGAGGAITGLAGSAGDCTTVIGSLTGVMPAATGATVAATGALTALAVQATLSSIALFTEISAIAGIVGAIAGIVGDVYLAAIDTKLFSIETSTNRTANDLANLRADQWDQFNGMYDRIGEIETDTHSMSDSLKQLLSLGFAASSGLTPTQASDLHTAAAGVQALLQPLQDTQKGVVQIDTDYVNEISKTDDWQNKLYDYLAVIDKDINTITTAIQYGGTSAKVTPKSQYDPSASAQVPPVAPASPSNVVGYDTPVSAQAHADAQTQYDATTATTTATTTAGTAAVAATSAASDAATVAIAAAQAAELAELQHIQSSMDSDAAAIVKAINDGIKTLGDDIKAINDTAAKIVTAVGQGTQGGLPWPGGGLPWPGGGLPWPGASGLGGGSTGGGSGVLMPGTSGSGTGGSQAPPATGVVAPPAGAPSGGNIPYDISAISANTGHISLTADQQINQGQKVVDQGQAALGAATDLAGQINALQDIIRGDTDLMNAEIAKAATETSTAAAQADLGVAASYQQAIKNATSELQQTENSSTSAITSGLATVYDATQAAQASGVTTGDIIVTAIGASAVTISQAVAAGAAQTGAAFGAALAGFGATTSWTPGRSNMATGPGSGGSTKPTSPYDPSLYNGTPDTGTQGASSAGPLGTYNPGPNPFTPPTAPNYGGIPGAYAPGPGYVPTDFSNGGGQITPPPAGTAIGSTLEGTATGPGAKAPTPAVPGPSVDDMTKSFSTALAPVLGAALQTAASTAQVADTNQQILTDPKTGLQIQDGLSALADRISGDQSALALQISQNAPPAMIDLLTKQLATDQARYDQATQSLAIQQGIATSSTYTSVSGASVASSSAGIEGQATMLLGTSGQQLAAQQQIASNTGLTLSNTYSLINGQTVAANALVQANQIAVNFPSAVASAFSAAVAPLTGAAALSAQAKTGAPLLTGGYGYESSYQGGAGAPASSGVPNNLPHFAEGGIMPYTGLAHMEAGEMALPPDLGAMLRRMASTPDMSYSPRNPAASAAVPPGSGGVQINNFYMTQSPRENAREIANVMRIQSYKMAALSS